VTIASLIVDIAANTVKLETDVKKVQSSLDSLGDVAKKMGAALGAAFGISTIGAAVHSFIEASSALTDLSQKSGISTTELQKLKFAAEQNGGSLDQMVTGIAKMGKALTEGGKGTLDALDRLHLSLSDLRQKDPGEAFAMIADAIAKVPNPLERSALAMALFGKAGADLLPTMTGNLKETMAAAEKLGIVIDEQTVKAGDDLGDTLHALQMVGLAIVAKVLAPMLPAFQMIASAMLGASEVVDYLRVMFDALARVILIAMKGLVDVGIRVGELAQKVPGLSKVFGENTAEMRSGRDASTWLAGAIAGLEKTTDAHIETTKKAVPPIQMLTKAQQDQADALDAIRKAHIPLTEAQKAAALENQKLGVSAETTAKALGISAAAVSAYLERYKNIEEIAEIWRHAHTEMYSTATKFLRDSIAATEEANKKEAEARGRALTEQLATLVEYTRKVQAIGLTARQRELHDIEDARRAAIDSLTKQFQMQGPIYDKAAAAINAYYDHQKDLAIGTAATIEERMAKQGVFTKTLMDMQVSDALRDYQQMLASGQYTATELRIAWQRYYELDQQLQDGWFAKWGATMGQFGAAMSSLASSSSGAFKSIVSDLAEVVSSLQDAHKSGEAFHEIWDDPDATGTQKFAALGVALSQAAAGLAKVTAQGTQAERALKGAAAGAAYGASMAGGYGAIAGAVVGAIVGWVRGMTAGRQAVIAFANSFADSGLNNGFENLHAKLQVLGAEGEEFWKRLTQAGNSDIVAAKKTLDDINAALAAHDAWLQRLPDVIQKYGLSWEQAGQQAKQAHLDDIAKGLIQDFADLSKAGFDIDLITQKMSDSINDYVHQAMATGTEIPAAMKPLLQKMIDLGTLTDAAGNKMDDLGGLTFAETLTEGFNSIVDAIHELTRALGAVPDAMNKIPRRVDVEVAYHETGRGNGDDEASRAATGGLVGFGKVIPFRMGGPVFSPMGTDTVPAMLTPGEIVLNAAQQRSVAGAVGGGNTYIAQGGIVVNGAKDPERVAEEIMLRLRRKKRFNAA
jgi:predicted transcriptional regulator